MAVPVNTGVVDTEKVLADEKVVDMAPEFALLDTDTSQFMTILDRLPERPARQIKVNWLEDEYFPNRSAVPAGATNVATSFDVIAGEGVYFRANDLVLVGATGEKILVSSISTDTLTVVRGIGGVAAAAIPTNGELIRIGNLSAQGADTGILKATKRVLGFNYTGIQRDPFGFTGTDVEIETYGADDPDNEIAKKGVEHRRYLEHQLWFGARAATGADGLPALTNSMGGVQEYIATNKFAAVGTLTLASFDDKLQQIFQHGSMNKVIFSAPTPAAALSRLLANNWVRATPDTRVYGAKVSGFVNGAYGENVPVIVKREWGRYLDTGDNIGTYMFVLDLEHVQRRPMPNRYAVLLPNRQLPGEDKKVWDILTEMSLEFKQERAHGLLTGVTG